MAGGCVYGGGVAFGPFVKVMSIGTSNLPISDDPISGVIQPSAGSRGRRIYRKRQLP